MGDKSPGLRLAPFAKLLGREENIDKENNEDPAQASEPSDQVYIHIDMGKDGDGNGNPDTKTDQKNKARSENKNDERRHPQSDHQVHDRQKDPKRFSARPVTWSRSPSPSEDRGRRQR